MLELAPGWSTEIERGPDWLFVRLRGSDSAADELDIHQLGEMLWKVLEQHFTYRLVLDLTDLPVMSSAMIGQLVLLHKRVANHGGVMRLCGLSDQNQEVLRACCLHTQFPQYRSREEAVSGYRPGQPR